MDRIQKQAILNDLKKKMVFLVGPRQVGKTWLAKDIAKQFKHVVFLNYDNREDRQIIQNHGWLDETDLLIFDELHKKPKWKSYIKGVFDKKLSHQHILVTGSARLDILKKIGEALTGRVFTHHLYPLSPAELAQLKEPVSLDKLIKHGGFPEPFLESNLTDVHRWRLQYVDGLIREDVFTIENVEHLRKLQLVLEMLRERVGSPISYKAIAEEAQIAPNTVKKYIYIFEALYIIFRVIPFSKNIARSLLKEPKVYFFDTGLVKGNEGILFENLVANCLYKHVQAKLDYLGEMWTLNYLRTKEGKEVDFVLTKDSKIHQMIEVKMSDTGISPSLQYFHQKYQFPTVQVVKQLRQEKRIGKIEIRRGIDFLSFLML